jgi:4-hydroxybenzoate polyprenyltransferase
MARSTLSEVRLPDVQVDKLRTSGSRPAVLSLAASLRPGQWTKNLLVFAPLVFAVRLFDLPSDVKAGLGFLLFCALSSTVYLVNDVMDRDADRQHPLKRLRPIAAGTISAATALLTAIVLGAAALAAAFALEWRFGAIAAGYVVLQLLYSARLKHIVIVDALTLAIGFVLRAIAGALVIDVVVSHWLFVCTILGALFIALAKRRHEIVLLAGGAGTHRPILDEYSPYLIDQMIGVVTASTLIAYIFYTISPETEQKFGTSWLGLTIPFAVYGILRYLYLVHRREGGGSPSDLLLDDRPLLACVTLWVIAVVLIIYHPFLP